MKRPFLIAAAICSAFIATAFYCKHTIMAVAFCLLLALIAALKFKNVRLIAVFLLALSVLSALFNTFSDINRLEALNKRHTKESLVISSVPTFKDGAYFVKATVLSDNLLKKGDKLQISFSDFEAESGDEVTAELLLEKPLNETFKKNLYSQNIFMTAKAYGIENTNDSSALLTFIPKLRGRINKIINTYSSEYFTRNFSLAVLLGEVDLLDDDFYANSKKTGTTHLLVVSGMHLVIILGGLYKLLSAIIRNKYLLFIVIFFSTLIFMGLCGFTMSVLRSGVSYLLLVSAPLFNRESDPLSSLCAAAVFIFIFNPFALFSISFQLSMLSTLGILTLSPFLDECLMKAFKTDSIILKNLFSAVTVTVSASLFTAPVLIITFGYLSTVFLIANILVGEVVNFILVLLVLGVAVGFVLPNFNIIHSLFYLIKILSNYTRDVVCLLGSLPFSAIEVPFYFAFVFIAAIISLLLIYDIKKRRNKNLMRKNI